MSHASFVRRAPDIAEEILAKTAGVLPGALKSFTRDLLTKEASAKEEALRLPARVTLEDLRKVASGNGTSLPKVAQARSEEAPSIVEGLRKIAERHEQEEADDVLASAVAILEKKAVVAVMSPMLGRAPKPKLFGGFYSPGASAEHKLWKAKHRAEMAEIPGTTEWSHVEGVKGLAEAEKAKAEAIRRGSETKAQLVQQMPMALPLTGAAIGTPLAVAAMSKDKRKDGETVKIYK